MSAQARFAGKVIRDDTTSKPGFWLAQALYGFNGSKHSFVAHNFITENDTTSPITATIRGVVIWGWMRGARVTGEYTHGTRAPSRRRATCSAASASRARSTSSSGWARGIEGAVRRTLCGAVAESGRRAERRHGGRAGTSPLPRVWACRVAHDPPREEEGLQPRERPSILNAPWMLGLRRARR